MARNTDIVNLVTVLDHLRESYDLAKAAGHVELQAHLMQARRLLLDSVRHNLDLHSQLFDLQALLAEAEAENKRLRLGGDSVGQERATPNKPPRLS